jgi:C4-dicarboxylate-specific signal transduction histidine kinase
MTTDFDLRDLALRIIADLGYADDEVVLYRDEPAIVRGDPELLALALRNLIANAVEASVETKKRVVVNYGVTESDVWIVVLDEGIGLPANFDKVWEPGKTLKSKKEHFGWGLSIAQRAVHSFNGSIRVTPREHGGTAGEIRWALIENSGEHS